MVFEVKDFTSGDEVSLVVCRELPEVICCPEDDWFRLRSVFFGSYDVLFTNGWAGGAVVRSGVQACYW